MSHLFPCASWLAGGRPAWRAAPSTRCLHPHPHPTPHPPPPNLPQRCFTSWRCAAWWTRWACFCLFLLQHCQAGQPWAADAADAACIQPGGSRGGEPCHSPQQHWNDTDGLTSHGPANLHCICLMAHARPTCCMHAGLPAVWPTMPPAQSPPTCCPPPAAHHHPPTTRPPRCTLHPHATGTPVPLHLQMAEDQERKQQTQHQKEEQQPQGQPAAGHPATPEL